MSTYNESLTQGSVAKGLLKFAIPVLLANILQIVYSTTDLIIVGRFATTADVSGVSTGSMTMGILTMAMVGLVMGVTVLIGHMAGARDETGIRRAVGTSIVFFILFTVAAMIPLIALNRWLVDVMNAPPEAVEQSRSYLLICSAGTPFIVGYNLFGSMIRGFGDSKTPLKFVGLSCAINVILDYVLIRWLHMGAAGAAVATVAAQGVSLVFSAIHVFRHTFGFRLQLRDLRIHGPSLRRLLKVGVPQSLQEVLVQISFMIITALINRMGLAQSAAGGVGEKIIIYLTMPSAAISSSVATMASHCLGAGKRSRAERCLAIGVFCAFCIGIVTHLVARFFGAELASIFTKDRDVVYHTALYLTTYTLDTMLTAFVFPTNSYLASCGYSVFAMAHSLVTTFLVRVPLAVLFSRRPGATLMDIGWAAPISSLASIVLCVLFLLLYVRRRKMPAERIAAEAAEAAEAE